MAQTGFTPIQLYFSSTTTNVPLAANLANGELAINITDGKLFYKDNASAVQVIGWKVVPATAGGTGQTSYAVGDLLYANTTTTLAKLPDVATGNALISGGVGVAPSYGKIGLTTHVSGTLPTANGGTNLTSFTANGVVYASSTSALATGSALTFDGTNFGVGVATPVSIVEASSTTPVITASQSSTSVLIDTLVGAFNAYSYDSTVNSKGGVGGVRVYSEATWNTGGSPSYLAFYTHPSSANNNTLLGGAVEAGRFDSSGNLKLAIGNLVVGTSGKGVDFAATAGTGTSELLADYEEGTWTPTFVPTTGAFTSITYTSTGGYYTKVGRLVCVTGRLRTNGITVGTASGSLFIGGLPFTSLSTTSAAQGGTLTVADPGGWTVNNPCFGFVTNGSTTILIQYRATANGAASDSNVTDLGTVGLANNLAFTAYYFTA